MLCGGCLEKSSSALLLSMSSVICICNLYEIFELIVDDDTSDNNSMKHVSDKNPENLEDFERLSRQYRFCHSALHQREDSIATVNYLSTNEKAVVRLPIIISPPMRRQY